MKPQPGATVAGKYELLRSIAEGGMGSIWVARHTALGTSVAIKFMIAALADTAVGRARFEREARAAAMLHSPHVVQIMDYGVDDDTPYLVMELLTGEDLAERLRKRKRLAVGEMSAILSQVARALKRAHELGIVHRDLKPNNIYLARVDDDEVVKVLDFGIAKDSTGATNLGDGTKTGDFLGSPKYMSPEQVRCEHDLDGRSDIWSLGVILYRALTGRLPFQADQPSAVLAQIVADPVAPPSTLFAELSPEVDAFFVRCLARDKTQRFQTVQEMANAFALVAGERPRSSGAYSAFPSIAPPGGSQQSSSATPSASPFPVPSAATPHGPLSTVRMPRDDSASSVPSWSGVGASSLPGNPTTLTTSGSVVEARDAGNRSPALLIALAALSVLAVGAGAYALINPLFSAETQAVVSIAEPTKAFEPPQLLEPAAPMPPAPSASAAESAETSPDAEVLDGDALLEPSEAPPKGKNAEDSPKPKKPPSSAKTASAPPAWGF